MAHESKAEVNIALVCPDGFSIILFCKEMIHSLLSIPNSRVCVICDGGPYVSQIEELGVTCISFPMYRWTHPLKDLSYTYKLWKIFREKRCDIVLNFTTKPNIFGAIAAKMARTEVLLTHVVGLGNAFAGREDVSGRLVRRIAKFLYRKACTWSDKVWFTNGGDLQFFVANNLVKEDKCVLTRNYLDVSEYSLEVVSEADKQAAREACKLKPDERVVIMVARMIWTKGVREFAEAAERLRDSHPDVKFILVAPLETGSYGAVPESYVREKELSANFLWLGFQRDVKRFYAIADLAVLPTYYKEGGYPRALLEPMAMGKPIITTDSEDCRGAVEEGCNGFLVPIRDSNALAEAITRVMDDQALRQKLGEYSHVKAERDFNEKSIVPAALKKMGLQVQIGC